MAFSLGPNPIHCREGNPIHHEGMDISRSPYSINLRAPKVGGGGGGEFSESRAIEDWLAPLGHFRVDLVSRAGVAAVVVTRAI